MIAALLLAMAAAPEPDWNCDEPQAQQEMNWCAAEDFRRADAALNAQWKLTAAEMKRRDADQGPLESSQRTHFDTLLEAQRAWLRYRDLQCEVEGFAFRGGTMEPLIVATCRTGLTEARTKELRELAEEG